jgi:chorismate synthase
LAGNSIGKEFTVTSFGESHGKVVGVVVDGCPSGLPLSEADFQEELDRRIPAEPKIVSARIEKDSAKILSGVLTGNHGRPIAVMVENKETNQRLRPLKTCLDLALITPRVLYGGFNDYRGGGRSEDRRPIMAGTIAAVGDMTLTF